jgi:hypothetical protein
MAQISLKHESSTLFHKNLLSLTLILILPFALHCTFQILPSGSDPLSQSISNASEESALNFNFQFDFSIKKYTFISITLPQGFAIDPAKVFCDPTCTLDVFNLRIKFSYSSGVEKLTTYSVSIFNVTNPALSGSTSPFAIIATSVNSATGQEFIFAENLNFATLGISSSLSSLYSVSFKMLDHHQEMFRNYLHSEIAKTSENLVFSLGFRVSVYTPKDISLILIFPIGSFQPDNLICLQESINLKRNLSDIRCRFNSDQRFMYIIIDNFQEDIPINDPLRFLITLRNPSYRANSTSFDMYIFKNNTNTAIAKALQIPLPEVLPNTLTKLSIAQINSEVVLSSRKVIWTLLKFSTLSTLPSSSEITIIFPKNLDLHVRSSSLADLQNSLLIYSGIAKASSESEIILKKDIISGKNRLTISNFLKHEYPQTIQLKLLLSIGDISDYSDYFLIETGSRDTSLTYTLMERDQSSLRLKILSVEVPSQHSLALSNELADASTITDIAFSFSAEVTVLENDYLILIVDDNINLSIVESHNCLALLTSTQDISQFSRDQQSRIGSDIYIKSQYCIGQNGKISMKIPFSYDIGQEIKLLLRQVIVSPSLSAEYLFDFSICRTQSSLSDETSPPSFTKFLVENMLLRRANLLNYFGNNSDKCEIYLSYTELPFFKPQNLTKLSVHFSPNVENRKGLLILKFLAPTNIISSPAYYEDTGSQDKR